MIEILKYCSTFYLANIIIKYELRLFMQIFAKSTLLQNKQNKIMRCFAYSRPKQTILR